MTWSLIYLLYIFYYIKWIIIALHFSTFICVCLNSLKFLLTNSIGDLRSTNGVAQSRTSRATRRWTADSVIRIAQWYDAVARVESIELISCSSLAHATRAIRVTRALVYRLVYHCFTSYTIHNYFSIIFLLSTILQKITIW